LGKKPAQPPEIVQVPGSHADVGSVIAFRLDRPARQRHAFLVAVALSGGAGLAYQVAWTRRIAGVTSATHTAQAIVLAVFMAGLGIGALLAGRRAIHLARPARAYAVAELIAVAAAAASMPLFTRSEALRGFARSLGADPALALAVQLAGLAIFLLIPTAAMGASIPWILEALERQRLGPERSARWMSALYAVNTLGAVAGCLVAGFLTIEHLGLVRTTWLGGSAALMAAALALAVDRRSATQADHPASNDPPVEGSAAPAAVSTWLAAGCAGFVGLAIEVVWTRLISLVVLNTVYAFTQVLASVLLGIAIGAGLAVVWIRRAHATDDPRASLARTAGGAAFGAALLFAIVPTAIAGFAGREDLEIALASGLSWRGNALLLLLMCPPSALVASLLPLLVAMARAHERGSERFAVLYAANTLGSVLGSATAGFVLLPLLGTAGSNLALVAITLGLAAVIRRIGVPRLAPSIPRRLALVGTAACALALAHASDLPRSIYEARLDDDTRVLEFREGAQSDVMITEDVRGRRRIWINSSWVAGTGGGHRSLGHIPALLVAEPRRALGIALGTGQTFASMWKHGIREFDCVELDAGVIALSTKWFADASDHLFERPGVRLHHDDCRAFLRATDETYDLIVLEPLQAWTAGTSNLYSREFYEEARAALAPGGVVAQWIPFYGQGVDETRSMVRAAREVFPEASLWLDDHDGILVLQNEPFGLDPGELARRIEARELGDELALNSLDGIEDLLSLFVMGPRALDAWQSGVPVLTDDRPFLEFAAARSLGHFAYRKLVASIADGVDPHARYLAATASNEDRRSGRDAATIREFVLRERMIPRREILARVETLERAIADAPHSRLIARRYRNLILEWATAMERNGKTHEAEAIYRRALRIAPELGEAAANLSLLYARERQFDLAQRTLDRPFEDASVRESARRVRERIEGAAAGE